MGFDDSWGDARPGDGNGSPGDGVPMDPWGLRKRGNTRPIQSRVTGLNSFKSRGYPSRKDYIKAVLKKSGSVVWWGVSTLCESTEIERRINSDESTIPQELDTEHPLDVSLRFIGYPSG